MNDDGAWVCPTCCLEYPKSESYCEICSDPEETIRDVSQMNLEELRFYFEEKNWEVTHIDWHIQEKSNSLAHLSQSKLQKWREKYRLTKYREFAQEGPYDLKYSNKTPKMTKSDSHPSEESPMPPEFDKLSRSQLDDFCSRLQIDIQDLSGRNVPDFLQKLNEFVQPGNVGNRAYVASLQQAHYEYTRKLQTLLELTISLSQLHLPFDDDYIMARIRDFTKLLPDLQDDISSIFVFGDASSGKSTFINLLVEADLLPASVEAGVTSTICELHGLKDQDEKSRLEAVLRDGSRTDPVYLDSEDINDVQNTLLDFVAEDCKLDEPQYSKVEIFWENNLLNSGIVLVDSPGLNDPKLDEEKCQWWLDNVKDHVTTSVATICLITPPGVTETVAQCLRLLVAEQKGANRYNPESIFFVLTHPDTLTPEDRAKMIADVKGRLEKLAPGCPLDQNMVAINLVAAHNVRRWNLYSPDHVQLLRLLENYFRQTFQFYLSNAWLNIFNPVQEIHRAISRKVYVKTGDRTEIQQKMKLAEIEVERTTDALEKLREEYTGEVVTSKDKICTKCVSHLKSHSRRVVTAVCKSKIRVPVIDDSDELKYDSLQLAVGAPPSVKTRLKNRLSALKKKRSNSSASTDSGKSGQSVDEMEDELYVAETKKRMLVEVCDQLEPLFVKESQHLLDVVFERAQQMLVRIKEASDHMAPDDTVPLEEFATAALSWLTLKQKSAGMIVAALGTSTWAGIWISVGVASAAVTPIVGWVVGGTALLGFGGYLVYKAVKLHKKGTRVEAIVSEAFKAFNQKEIVQKMLDDANVDIESSARNMLNLVESRLNNLNEKVQHYKTELENPDDRQTLEQLLSAKDVIDRYQASLWEFYYDNLCAQSDIHYTQLSGVKPIMDSDMIALDHCRLQRDGMEEKKDDATPKSGLKTKFFNMTKRPSGGEGAEVDVIVKTFKKENPYSLGIFSQELHFLRTYAVSDNLAEFYGFSKSKDGEMQLVMEFINGGALSEWIENAGEERTLSECIQIATGMARAMKALSNKKLAHKDLVPQNVLVSTEGKMKVKVGRHFTSHANSLSSLADEEKEKGPTDDLRLYVYKAPESIYHTVTHPFKLDVYSFGIILWELWHCATPFSDCDEGSSVIDLRTAVRTGKRPLVADRCPKKYANLFEDCWHPRPSRRPNWDEILTRLKKM